MKLIALLQHRRARIAFRVLPPALLAIGVAYRAKPVVRAQAAYALNFVGLDGILNLFE